MSIITELKKMMNPGALMQAMVGQPRPDPKIKPSLATVNQSRKWQDRNKYVVNGRQFPPGSKKRLRKEIDFVVPETDMLFEKANE